MYFTFSLWVLDGELFTENSEIEVFKPDNYDLIFEDSETTLSLSINEYCGRELFTHLCIKFSSKPFEDWDRDLPFTSFGKHSFRKFWCSTSVVFSRATNTSSLIFCISNSNHCSNNLSCLCARSSACLAGNLRLTCSAIVRSSLTDKYDEFEDPVAESEDFERALAFFLEGLELCELVALPLSQTLSYVMSSRKIWKRESEQYDFSTLFSEKIDLSDWCEELLVLGRLDGLLI